MALSLNAASASDIAYFKDVLKPGGHARSMAAKVADGQACGVSGDTVTVLMPAFQTCMSGRGWALDHYGPDPASPRPRDTAVNFTDVKGDARQQPRGNAALQSDTRACDAGGKDLESASFKACMAGRGWQFAFTQRAPARRSIQNTGRGRPVRARPPAPTMTTMCAATRIQTRATRPSPTPSTPRARRPRIRMRPRQRRRSSTAFRPMRRSRRIDQSNAGRFVANIRPIVCNRVAGI